VDLILSPISPLNPISSSPLACKPRAPRQWLQLVHQMHCIPSAQRGAQQGPPSKAQGVSKPWGRRKRGGASARAPPRGGVHARFPPLVLNLKLFDL
jgi:hypothetical protein